METPAQRLSALGFEVPQVATPIAAYVPASSSGSMLFTSGQLPMRDGRLLATGKLGAEVDEETGRRCAELAALNALSSIGTVADLDQVDRILKLVVYVASSPSFSQQSVVANGASDLFVSVFGDAGRHARSAIGVAVLPLDSPVELELIVRLKS